MSEPTPSFWQRAYVPLWCLMWIEIWTLIAYWMCTAIPDVPMYSFMHYGDSLLVPRTVTATVALLILAICLLHKRIESWVLWFAPQVQYWVRDGGMPEPDEEEEEDDDDE